jgi:hypothetical protein
MALPDWLQRLTPFDRKLLMVVMVGIALSFLLPLSQGSGTRVVASSGDKIIFVAPLDQPRQVSLEGPLGITKVDIDDGRVKVISSPCPNKTCIRMGEARQAGDLIACVPNRLIIRIEGKNIEEEPGYDLISR